MTDAELLQLARTGDSASLGLLLEQYRPKLYASALRWLGFRPEAEDAVSDVMLIALSKFRQVHHAERIGGWLTTVLRNVCMMHLRAGRREVNLPHDEALRLADQVASNDNPEKALDESCVRDWLWNALESLSDTLRVTVMLRHFGSHASYEEIAVILGVPVGTVRSRLAQARALLADRLSREVEGRFKDARAQSLARGRYFQERVSALYETGRLDDLMSDFHRGLLLVVDGMRRAHGYQSWRKLLIADLEHGSRFVPHKALSSGNVTILEGPNVNSDKFPDRCPPQAVSVMVHQDPEGAQVNRLYVYGTPPSPQRT